MYDVAISFAGPQREVAEALASASATPDSMFSTTRLLTDQLWGQDLAVFFEDTFRNKARYCQEATNVPDRTVHVNLAEALTKGPRRI